MRPFWNCRHTPNDITRETCYLSTLFLYKGVPMLLLWCHSSRICYLLWHGTHSSDFATWSGSRLEGSTQGWSCSRIRYLEMVFSYSLAYWGGKSIPRTLATFRWFSSIIYYLEMVFLQMVCIYYLLPWNGVHLLFATLRWCSSRICYLEMVFI